MSSLHRHVVARIFGISTALSTGISRLRGTRNRFVRRYMLNSCAALPCRANNEMMG